MEFRMKRFPGRYKPIQKIGALIALGVLLLSSVRCLIPIGSNDNSDPFTFVNAGDGDTITPYGSIAIRFTRPVAHPDSVHFLFDPPFADFLLASNTKGDTLTMQLSLPLNAETRYSIHLKDQITAKDGTLLFPNDDSVVVVTADAEQEPNDQLSTADLLVKKIFGAIASADDTDWFAISDTALREFYLTSHGSSSRFDVRDVNGTVLVKPSLIAPAETLLVPSNSPAPRYLVVSAWNRSNGGYYELGGK
jgi:hypothetical protein